VAAEFRVALAHKLGPVCSAASDRFASETWSIPCCAGLRQADEFGSVIRTGISTFFITSGQLCRFQSGPAD